MWTYIYLALFFGTFVALLVVLNAFTRKIGELEKQRAAIQVEEDRVFDFLHGLGEAFSEGVRSVELHRLIVESAMRILDAHGGVLYLADRNDGSLAPAYVSKNCPAIIEVPQHIIDQAAVVPMALESFLRLHSIRRGEGTVGKVWETGQAGIFTAADIGIPPGGSHSGMLAHSCLVGPLIYRRKTLGVLGVANGSMSMPFVDKDLNVFKTIIEQSAFALYNEVVYLEASEKKRLDHDLEIARDIQRILLPSSSPQVEGFEISGLNIAARHVSGDYYDYVKVDERRTGIAIADVSGKGIPASLIMAMCRSVLRSQAPGKLSPAEVFRLVNHQLYPDIREDMFISMAYLVLDPVTSEVTLARAGHDAPLLYRAATGQVEKLTPKGMALGIDSGDVFNKVCADLLIRMEPGDCLLLYTDGATEALDANGLEFGVPRLIQGLQASAPKGAEGVIRRITDDLKGFVGNYPQYDDITLISIHKK